MGDRLESRNVLYPFTPSAEVNRVAVETFLDALIIVGPSGLSGGGFVRSVFLKRTTAQEIVFGIQCERGEREMSFPAPNTSTHLQSLRGNSPDGASVLVVDGAKYIAPLTFPIPSLVELEPARVVWLPEILENVVFYNTKSCVDPADPENGTLTGLPVTVPGNLAFEDGYNTIVVYDEASGTLTFQGGAGYGKGKPTAIPWSCGTPADRLGLISVNGVRENLGNLQIAVSESLTLTQTNGTITIGRSS